MRHSEHGMLKDAKSRKQPSQRAPARTTAKTHPDSSARREATRDPTLNDPDKTPGSGMVPDDRGDAPTG